MEVVLNFHTKAEVERLQSGAGRPLLGRPAWERPVGPTLQPLGLNFGVEVKHNLHNSVELTLSLYRPLASYK